MYFFFLFMLALPSRAAIVPLFLAVLGLDYLVKRKSASYSQSLSLSQCVSHVYCLFSTERC